VADLRCRGEDWKGQEQLSLVLIDPVEALENEEENRWSSSPQAGEDITFSLRLPAQDHRRIQVVARDDVTIPPFASHDFRDASATDMERANATNPHASNGSFT